MKTWFLFLLLVSLLQSDGCTVSAQAGGLKNGFYKKSCPQAEQIVQNIIWQHVAGNPELAAKFLRMFFHDCFVRGCDASILIDSTPNNPAEKSATPNLSLAGFDVIDKVKAALEQACPNTVSCADIVALAARDSVAYQYKKNLWEVQTGRRDGTVSSEVEANANIPSPFSNFQKLVSNFSSKGLGVQDLVVLSGGHTIGVGHCNLFSKRLFNFTGKDDADPSLNPPYAAFLRSQCKNTANNVTTVPMDPGSSTSFDNHYFVNLKLHQGLFTSDASLLTTDRSSKIVDKLLDAGTFFNEFKNSITRMGQIGVLTGTNGQIRRNCPVVNS